MITFPAKYRNSVIDKESAQLCPTLWTVAHQAPLSMGILQARILECPCPLLGDLSNPGIKPWSPALQADFFYHLRWNIKIFWLLSGLATLITSLEESSWSIEEGDKFLVFVVISRNCWHSCIFLFLWLFFAMWDLSSPIRDQTWGPCSGSVES